MADFANILEVNENGLVVASTSADIKNLVVEDVLKKSYINPDVDDNTTFGQLAKTYTDLIKKMQTGLIYVLNLQSIDHTSNVDFTSKLKGFFRKSGFPTQTLFKFKNTPNYFYPNGTIISNDSGTITFMTENDLTLDKNGEGSVMGFCTKAGAINPPLNTINKLVSDTLQAEYVSNEEPAIVGSDEETDTQFIQRIKAVHEVNEDVFGTLDAIKRAILDLDNVIDVYGVENTGKDTATIGNITLDPHSISLVVNGGTLNEIAKAIKQKKNVGCGTTGNITASYVYTDNGINYIDNYFIYRPSIVNFYLKIQYSKNIKTPNNIETLIKNYLLDWQQKNPFKLGTTIFATQLIQALNSILYQFNIINIQVKKFNEDDFTSFINMTEQEFAVLLNSNIILENV